MKQSHILAKEIKMYGFGRSLLIPIITRSTHIPIISVSDFRMNFIFVFINLPSLRLLFMENIPIHHWNDELVSNVSFFWEIINTHRMNFLMMLEV